MFGTLSEYANLINTALLLGMIIFLWRLSQMIIKSKESQINTLQQQLELSKAFGVEDAVSKFESLKKYYEGQRDEWYQITLQKLNREKEEAIRERELHLESTLQLEIEELKRIKEKSDKDENIASSKLEIEEILGSYRVFGYNPYDIVDKYEYEGELHLTSNKETIKAVWSIAQGRQRHEGIGTLKNNILGIHFWYTTINKEVQNGIVLYEFMGKDIIRGVWTGKGADKVGYEEGQKIHN